jgi:hypothetical protein
MTANNEQQRLNKIIEAVKQAPEGKILLDSAIEVEFMKEPSNLRGHREPGTQLITLNPELSHEELLGTLMCGIRAYEKETSTMIGAPPMRQGPSSPRR